MESSKVGGRANGVVYCRVKVVGFKHAPPCLVAAGREAREMCVILSAAWIVLAGRHDF